MKFKFFILAISRIKQAVFNHFEMKKSLKFLIFSSQCYRNISCVPYIQLNVFIEKSNASLSSIRVIFLNEKVHYIFFSMLLKTTSVVSKAEQ